ncbi:LA2681 family HEPN domain-containing protein [Pseudomonas mosselii]|uniref:LA2681 family HEPN domain-containing protein n=1 Tax=Pseudomonas mosselii TaxID=78327 RepID=UPI0021D95D8C|nr:LA2681 family HEPN domain-containing protein [Pseudomonas mosselii]MCU9530258.1 LA2681 family HEPN domain-containing protein [Pseudomonas mosselii]MCU9537297.1 LA2681 family HEPN domain-containing protein [Pseudomonas mosselii]MCU9542330.1 LA2681 family HEPN domain-containing protein [Pseudomonas mosselii]MCU9549275.1 LA2681 family HEPN domain-containing protein [Pseudomonas mosselii]
MVEELSTLHELLDAGEFSECYSRALMLLERTKSVSNDTYRMRLLFNISGILADVGGMSKNREASSLGLELMEANKLEFIGFSGEGEYYYNLSNARASLIKESDPFKHTFKSIEELIEIKALLWKSLRYHQKNSSTVPPQLMVNLGNILKRQFRLSESLHFYDRVNSLSLDIPEAWINRSEALKMLNQISGSYSVQMLHEVKSGYEKAANSIGVPPPWRAYYKTYVSHLETQIQHTCEQLGIETVDPTVDSHDTQAEFSELTDFRRFVLSRHLSLSEHGLYCACMGSARDNLTIPTASGIVGDFVPAMEMVLNRLKSEFSLARLFYYEHQNNIQDNESKHESCFSELFNGELLSMGVEKLRTSFRLCFGILDKIGAAICDLYPVHPGGDIYFHNFWRLEKSDRRELFESIKTPGLMALYSLATDLNKHKDGELAFYKDWRNNFEHKFVVLYAGERPVDIYGSFEASEDIELIPEAEFVGHLEQLLQITRSAIFSFVFCVREKAERDRDSDEIYASKTIDWQAP